MPDTAISVLIVDDSALMRNLIGRIIESDPTLSLAGKAMNGHFALQKIPKLNPDVIVLDLEMPEMNGLELLEELNKKGVDIPIIILSSIATKGARITMDALSLGASDFITKPSTGSDDLKIVGTRLCETVRAYGNDYRRKKGKNVIHLKEPEHREPETSAPERIVKRTDQSEMAKKSVRFTGRAIDYGFEKVEPLCNPGSPEILAIGISTGGPNALRKVFSELKADFPLPIVVVQHMPAGFTAEFANSLNRICPLDVKEAQEGDLVKPGRILIAPGDRHIVLEKRALATIIHTQDTDAVNGHRPSVDVLFESLAKEFKNRSLAVIMTGMGKDGARQIGQVYKQGGMTVAQDESSSIVYGMPKVATENKYIHHVVSLEDMSTALTQLASG